MVGLFSRFSGGHRRSQSAVPVLAEISPPNVEVGGSAPMTTDHGIEITFEFKPVEHPTEPINRDHPVKCPLPEPSILNDGRIWKERMSSTSSGARANMPVVKEGSKLETETERTEPRLAVANRHMLPSYSAPEHNLINLLEECNSSEGRPIA